eukprot:6363797-Pyramimonas_sp.AAC.1
METYRRMRAANKDRWEEHHPRTNCMWVHYLADTILTKKGVPMSGKQKKELGAFRQRALKYARAPAHPPAGAQHGHEL